MIPDFVQGQYKRSAVGLVMLGSLVSFALGQHVGHGRTVTQNSVHTHGSAVTSVHSAGAIGTAVVPFARISAATTRSANLPVYVTVQTGQSEDKHGHGHDEGDGHSGGSHSSGGDGG